MTKLQGCFYSKRPIKQDLQTKNVCKPILHLLAAFQVRATPSSMWIQFDITGSFNEAQTFKLLSLVEAEGKLRYNLD